MIKIIQGNWIIIINPLHVMAIYSKETLPDLINVFIVLRDGSPKNRIELEFDDHEGADAFIEDLFKVMVLPGTVHRNAYQYEITSNFY